MSSQLLRQDFIPMVAGYVIVMAALALGLRATLRPGKPVRPVTPRPGKAARPVTPRPGKAARPVTPRPGKAARRGSPAGTGRPRWRRLATRVAGTAVGGYLLLMLMVIGYYYGVARVGGAFIESAFTGCAMLIGVAAPVFAALSWLTERRRQRATAPSAGYREPG
jgi:hypothetical protein